MDVERTANTMTTTRTEHDMLGEKKLPSDALYGIHTARAMKNFSLAGHPVHPALIQAYGAVKLAAAETNHAIGCWIEPQYNAIAAACREMMNGSLTAEIRVDALQGGAGTATNMNVNEVLANRALQTLGYPCGDYAVVSPLDDINRHQSTNDTFPTALKLAAITQLRALEQALVALLTAFQKKEKAFAAVVKVGRTQLQDAVLTTMGRSMSAYAEAIGRDRWRIHKCEERLRVVNLGGTAIGTGLAAPRPYIFGVVERLKAITGIGFSRAENMVECTQNADAFAEVSGMLNTCAANLVKIGQDLRLMSSGPAAGLGELKLPAVQAGSSIMPGKVNPVIPEAVIQAGLVVSANHVAITQAVSMGNLELNAFLPLIADRLLNSLDLLTGAVTVLHTHCIEGLAVNTEACRAHLDGATATVTALVDRLGYDVAGDIANAVRETGRSAREIVLERDLLDAETFDRLVSAAAVMQLGHREDS